jgi:hypothetical protein
MSDPSLSFEAFCADPALLGQWHTGSIVLDGDKVATPLQAASLATFKAVTAKRGQRGIVRIICSNSDQVRSCRDYLESFMLQPLLKAKARRVTGEGIELHGGITIECTTSAVRPPHGVLATILLDAGRQEQEIDPMHRARAIHFALFRVAFGHDEPGEREKALAICGAIFRRDDETAEQALERELDRIREYYADLRASGEERLRAANVGAEHSLNVPASAFRPEPPEPAVPGVGPDGYFTREYELRLREKKERQAIEEKPGRAILGRANKKKLIG